MSNGKVIPAKKCVLVGIGMGNWDTLTVASYRHLEKSPLLIGSKRVLDSMPDTVHGLWKQSINPEQILEILEKWQTSVEAQSATFPPCVVFSGDTGFYSGSKKLLPILEKNGYSVEVVPGITSSQYLAAKMHQSWQDWCLKSAHGIDCDIAGTVRKAFSAQSPHDYKGVFFLTGGKISADVVISRLCMEELGDLPVVIGEKLSYKDEKIYRGSAEEFLGQSFKSLSVVLVERGTYLDEADRTLSGIDDAAFIRSTGEKVVPMTKSEVRAVLLSKLNPKYADVVFDIGSGSGSVSVELAVCAYCKVFAIEKNPEAAQITRKNIEKFHSSDKITLIEGEAPSALKGLPCPNAVFIGGSDGNLFEIIKYIRKKNKDCKILISAVTTETLAEAIFAAKKIGCRYDITEVAIARSREAGSHHLMTAQNPVSLIRLF